VSYSETAPRARGDRATMPNFLVIGAAKAGTTALYRYLGQHPQIYTSSIKEPNFFALKGALPNFRGPGAGERINRWSVPDLEGYLALFEEVSNEKAVGEASPLYLYNEKVPERIRHYVPQARLVAVLRDPVERAYSSFLHLVRNGREPLSDFAQALAAEKERIRNNWEWIWHYKSMGFYHEQLSRYYEAFGRNQIRIYLHEDLEDNPLEVLRDLFSFLGVDDSFVPKVTSTRYNATGVPRSKTFDNILRSQNPLKAVLKPLLPKKLRRRLNVYLQNKLLVKPPFPEETRRRLVEEYREDVSNLQELIGRDLSGWLR
jgi:hypothetical protein